MTIEIVRVGPGVETYEFECGHCGSVLRCSQHDLVYGAIRGKSEGYNAMGYAVGCPVCSGRVIVRVVEDHG